MTSKLVEIHELHCFEFLRRIGQQARNDIETRTIAPLPQHNMFLEDWSAGAQ